MKKNHLLVSEAFTKFVETENIRTMKITHFLTATILAAMLLTARAAETPKVGAQAPAFEAQDQDGKTVKLSDFTGKQAVLLYFYPGMRPPVARSKPAAFVTAWKT